MVPSASFCLKVSGLAGSYCMSLTIPVLYQVAAFLGGPRDGERLLLRHTANVVICFYGIYVRSDESVRDAMVWHWIPFQDSDL